MAILYPSRIKLTNTGDQLINALLIREVLNYRDVLLDGPIPEAMTALIQSSDLSTRHRLFIAKKRIGRFSNKPVFRWLNLIFSIRSIQGVVDTPGHHTANGRAKSLLKSVRDLLRGIVLFLLGKDFYKIGVTLDIYGKDQILIQRWLSRFTTVIAVRDDVNYHRLLQLGIRNLKKIDDLAMLMYGWKETDRKKDGIVISLRGSLIGEGVDRDYLEPLMDSIVSIVSSCDQKDLPIVLVHQVKGDLEVAKLLQNRLSDKREVVIRDELLGVSDAMDVYASARIVLTNRLHVALIAFQVKTLTFVVTDRLKHAKVVNVFDSIGLGDFVIDIHNKDNIPDCSTAKIPMQELQAAHDRIKRELKDVFDSRPPCDEREVSIT